MSVSAIGFKSIETVIKVSKHNKVFNYTLKPDVAQLSEVGVVSKSDARKEREKGFALSVVDTKKSSLEKFCYGRTFESYIWSQVAPKWRSRLRYSV